MGGKGGTERGIKENQPEGGLVPTEETENRSLKPLFLRCKKEKKKKKQFFPSFLSKQRHMKPALGGNPRSELLTPQKYFHVKWAPTASLGHRSVLHPQGPARLLHKTPTQRLDEWKKGGPLPPMPAKLPPTSGAGLVGSRGGSLVPEGPMKPAMAVH